MILHNIISHWFWVKLFWKVRLSGLTDTRNVNAVWNCELVTNNDYVNINSSFVEFPYFLLTDIIGFRDKHKTVMTEHFIHCIVKFSSKWNSIRLLIVLHDLMLLNWYKKLRIAKEYVHHCSHNWGKITEGQIHQLHAQIFKWSYTIIQFHYSSKLTESNLSSQILFYSYSHDPTWNSSSTRKKDVCGWNSYKNHMVGKY